MLNQLDNDIKQYCTPENPFPDREAEQGYIEFLNEQESKCTR